MVFQLRDRPFLTSVVASVVASIIVLSFPSIVAFLVDLVVKLPPLLSDRLYRVARHPQPSANLLMTASIIQLLICYFLLIQAASAHVQKHFRIGAIILALAVLTTVPIDIARVAGSSIRATFEYRLTIIAPYISDQTQKQLRSAFAMMKGRADFDAIERTIFEEATKANVPLKDFE